MHPNVFIPQAFIDLMQEQMPSHLSLDELLDVCRRPLKRSIRVNTLKINVEEFKNMPMSLVGNSLLFRGVRKVFG
ncbi:ribosomal RNA small subunit methyltransferase F [Vibrio sp. JCM 19236]|nr:ribosomal RNA small subunit methyltransferase F [Vibrio sp. JCM 19236]